MRFPRLARVIGLIFSRLPPRSHLRRAMVSRILRKGCQAANRRDFELLFLVFDPKIEYEFGGSPTGGFVPPDLVGVQHGHEGYLRVWEAGIEAFDIKLDYEEVIDFGDRLLTVGRQTGQGRASGVPVDQRIFQVVTLRRGLIIRQRDFPSRAEALESVRLSARDSE